MAYANSIKTVLITGGAGFLGLNLCKSLLSNGYSVICLDNLSTSSPDSIKKFEKGSAFQFKAWKSHVVFL